MPHCTESRHTILTLSTSKLLSHILRDIYGPSLPLKHFFGIIANMGFLKTPQTSNQALVAPGKAGQSNSKTQDLKPRLLLMGLRR